MSAMSLDLAFFRPWEDGGTSERQFDSWDWVAIMLFSSEEAES